MHRKITGRRSFVLMARNEEATESGMGLTIGSINLAETRVQGVTLRPLVGGYELIFGLYVTTHAEAQPVRRASIHGARITVKPDGGKGCQLGFARPEGPFEIIAYPHQSSMTPGLYLPLQPGQIAALEVLRGTGDLTFELMMTGAGIDQNGAQQVQEEMRVTVSRSDWIRKLGDAGARDVLLLEVPLPLHPPSEAWDAITASLRRAEQQYRGGDYHSCVGSCRTVIQELGHHRFGDEKWASAPLDRLATGRNGMSKAEREVSLWAVMRHYTHQAHHGVSEGGAAGYTRAEAQFVLTLTAAAVAHAQGE